MTIKEAIEELFQGGLVGDIRTKAHFMLESGAVDTSDSTKNMLIAKALVYSALKTVTENYRPLSKEGKKIVANLKHF